MLNKRLTLNLPISFTALVLSSAVITFLCFALQPMSIGNSIICFKESLLLTFLLNLIPILLLMVLLFFVCNNLIAAIGLPGILFFVISVVNRTKINMRQSPLTISELTLAREVIAVSQNLSKSLILFTIFGLFALIAGTAVTMYFVRNAKPSIPIRIGGVAAVVVVLVLLNGTVYSNRSLYNGFFVIGSQYNQIDNFNSKGLIYSMIFTHNTTKVTRPDNYQSTDAEEFLASLQTNTKSSEVLPDIIVIMSEAYSDISENAAFDFTGYTDPMKNYKDILNSSVSGHIVTPSFGGGTSETEFDVITGINSRQFRNGVTAYSMVKHDMDSMAWQLRGLGYYAEGMHPGEPWFYDRVNVYRNFGFQAFFDMYSFNMEKRKGPFVSEAETIDFLIRKHRDYTTSEPETPYYAFMVNIQNHGPYTSRYDAETNFNSAVEFNELESNQLSNYFDGMIDCDRELLNLTSYLNKQTRPTLLLYFGDHLPNIESSIYDKLLTKTSDELYNQLAKHTIPYFIWQNDAYKSVDDFMHQKTETFSSFYLGAYMLDLVGLKLPNPYFSYVNSLREKYPVVMESHYMNKDGEFHQNDTNDEIRRLRSVEYYKIFDEDISAGS